MAEKFEWKRNESGEVIQRAAICQRSRRPALNYEPAPSVSATTVRPLPAGALHATGAAGWSKGLPEAASAGTQWGGGGGCFLKARRWDLPRLRPVPRGGGSGTPGPRVPAGRGGAHAGMCGAPGFPVSPSTNLAPLPLFLPHWEPGNGVNRVSNTWEVRANGSSVHLSPLRDLRRLPGLGGMCLFLGGGGLGGG